FLHRGRFKVAMKYLAKARNQFETLGDLRGAAIAAGNMGVVALRTGQFAEAESLLNEELRLYEQLGDRGVRFPLTNLGQLYTELGRMEEAQVALSSALASAIEENDQITVVEVVERIAQLRLRQGDATWAAMAFAFCSAERKRLKAPLAPYDRRWHRRALGV